MSNLQEYYEQITYEDYRMLAFGGSPSVDVKYCDDTWVDFTIDEVEKIQYCIDNFTTFNSDYKFSTSDRFLNRRSVMLIDSDHLVIVKLKYDWYICYQSLDSYYKCDQFDGLLMFIKEEYSR